MKTPWFPLGSFDDILLLDLPEFSILAITASRSWVTGCEYVVCDRERVTV